MSKNKVRINPDSKDPLWNECVKRFDLEVRAPPAKDDTQAFYYKATRGRLKATDYNWFLLDGYMIIREKKIEGSGGG